MREEIVVGLKNAINRGASLESAVQSFINAGYNPIEVREAAQFEFSGVSHIISAENAPELSAPEKKPEQKGKGVLIAGIIISAIIFLGAIGYLIYTLLK